MISGFPCNAIVQHNWAAVSDFGGSFTFAILGPWAIVKLLDRTGWFD
jgi:hypothetical protein